MLRYGCGAVPDHAFLSVEQVAQILGLHVRTVRTDLRNDSLQNTRIGPKDLERFTGRAVPSLDERESASGGRADVSTVITLDGISAERAAGITRMLAATEAVLRSIEQPAPAAPPRTGYRRRSRARCWWPGRR